MKYWIPILLLFALASCQTNVETEVEINPDEQIVQPKAKNVILLVGDGMGVSQVSSSFYFDNPVKEPNFMRFPVTGLSRTSSAKQKITDSAAGAMAFASGIKSYNGAIAVDTNKQAVPTIIELIESTGVASGLVATSSITHATPACFYAHAPSRNMADTIAFQMSTSGVDFFAGGGLKFFHQREDSLDVLGQLAGNGFVIDTSALAVAGTLDDTKKYGFLLAADGLPSMQEGRGNFLTEATELALSYLSKNEQGFFLMVEGSQIDWMGHGTDVEGVVQEVRDFDKALGAALDFAEKDGNTLVIVTADHETGGFTLSPRVKGVRNDYNDIEGSFYDGSKLTTSAGHTAAMVPVFAYGPGAEDFTGIYQNNEIFHKMMRAAGW